MRTWSPALLALLLVAPVLAQEPTSDVRQALAQIADASTVELSTVGRKTRRIHTRPVWFVVDGDKVVVQSGKDGRTDWYRNLEKNPQATLRTAEWVFTVSGSVVNDAARVDEIHRLFMQKYRTAWLLSLVGSSLGRGRPVELKIEKAAPRQ